MFEQGDKIKLTDPRPSERKVYGQSEYPKGFTATVDGESVFIPWGTILKVSAYTSEPVASMDTNPVPLVNKKFANDNSNMFELIESASTNE